MKGLVIKNIVELTLEAPQNVNPQEVNTKRSQFSIVEDKNKNKYIFGGKDN